MSTSTAVRTTARVPRPAAPPEAPRLRVVSLPGPARSRAGLAAACLAVLVVGLVGLLLLNVNLERGAYLLREQQSRSDQLRERRQALREQLQQLAAPQRLAARATELGMVPAPNAAFQTTSGKRLGVATPAKKPPSPTVSKSPRSATSSGTSSQPTAAGRTASGTRSADTAARTAKPTRATGERSGAQAGGGTASGAR